MDQVEMQGKAVEALKLFNNTITTSRLYPPEAPQVANAVDRGFIGVKKFVEQYNTLEFLVKEDSFYLGGSVLTQEILQSFTNLIVYRQLRLLGLTRLVVDMNLDRFAFDQLLLVFTASAEKIKNAGGGLSFVTSLGLASYFSHVVSVDGEGAESKKNGTGERAKQSVTVRPELVACLLGKDQRPLVVEELRKKMKDPALATQIMASGIGKILQGIRKKNTIFATPFFPRLLNNGEVLLDKTRIPEVASGLASFLDGSLKETALTVLLCQEYPEGFGAAVYENLIRSLSMERFGRVIVIFREQIAKARADKEDPGQVQFLDQAFHRLISGEKGKHFLSTEKVKTIIKDGEKDRKKKRLEAGITGLVAGNLEVLEREELLDHLPRSMGQLIRGANKAYVPKILANMIAYLSEVSGSERENVVESIIGICGRLLEAGAFEQVDVLTDRLMVEARNNISNELLFEKNIAVLHTLMQSYWGRQEDEKSDRILKFFYQMRSGKLSKPAPFKQIAGKIQDSNIDRAELPGLLTQCLAAPRDKQLTERLILQGPVVIRFLVEALIQADNSDDRIKIIDMLSNVGTFLPGIIHERLPAHMPWFGKRNLIRLLAEIGSEKDVEGVVPYLRHSDFRVQREAFFCIYKIGGRQRKELFLSVLHQTSEMMKILIVEAFGDFCDREVALQLDTVLTDHSHFSDANCEKLLLVLVETLGRCHCSEAQKTLMTFVQGKGQRVNRHVSDRVWVAAEKAINYLEEALKETRKKHLQANQLRKNALKQAAKLSKIAADQNIITGLPQEQVVRNLLASDDKDGAAEQLVELIEKTARLRNFMQAEKLKEWLIDIDGSGLNTIIAAGEIIDRERRQGVSQGHLDIWNSLYDVLSSEEFEELFSSFIHKTYGPGESVVSQGALQSALFFINAGKVKLFFQEQGSEVLVKTMEKGEIFGAGVFFDASIWTLSVSSIGSTDISVLRFDRLQRWKEKFPELEGKLKKFCAEYEGIDAILAQAESDRRVHQRMKVGGQITVVLLDSKGRRLGGPQEVELLDISMGGVSYRVETPQTKKDNVRHLLGQRVQVELPGVKPGDDKIIFLGDVIAARKLVDGAEFSLHVKFNQLLDTTLLENMIRVFGADSQKS